VSAIRPPVRCAATRAQCRRRRARCSSPVPGSIRGRLPHRRQCKQRRRARTEPRSARRSGKDARGALQAVRPTRLQCRRQMNDGVEPAPGERPLTCLRLQHDEGERSGNRGHSAPLLTRRSEPLRHTLMARTRAAMIRRVRVRAVLALRGGAGRIGVGGVRRRRRRSGRTRGRRRPHWCGCSRCHCTRRGARRGGGCCGSGCLARALLLGLRRSGGFLRGVLVDTTVTCARAPPRRGGRRSILAHRRGSLGGRGHCEQRSRHENCEKSAKHRSSLEEVVDRATLVLGHLHAVVRFTARLERAAH